MEESRSSQAKIKVCSESSYIYTATENPSYKGYKKEKHSKTASI